ncbi:MAG: hypothetical protein OEM77_01655 [Nitrosopumilus sp.]|nr:hypothetical protein [Nitrosopumilus sp.]MDH3736190.1 hypothetical protein [Nitrosopumilus sp.]MDH3822524.1 hypothetical protein [Nitrosopumilus sp.]MDH3833472.1 hypothetical protein [Nitrosopumilus sp.]
MNEKKTSKIREIKETASDAAEIIRQFGNPGVLESLNKVKDTAKIVNEIIQGLTTSEMVRNIENIRLISENLNEVSTKMENTASQLRETGVIYEASELMKSAKGSINSFSDSGKDSINGQDLRDVSVASKEMLLSIKDLMNEITVTFVSSKKSATIHNVKDTIKEGYDIYKTTTA